MQVGIQAGAQALPGRQVQAPGQMWRVLPCHLQVRRPAQGRQGETVYELAILPANPVRDATGPFGDQLRLCIGAAQQGGEHTGLGPVEPGRMFAEQTARSGGYPGQFTAKIRQVEVGFQDLFLAPALF